jgi:hypothetical protein
MYAASHQRGNRLLTAHCAALDPDSVTARKRLDAVLGKELAQKLVFALAGGGSDRQRAGDTFLGARAVFAA